MATTKQPTGLTVSREKNVFYFEWNYGDDNYDSGIRVAYRYKTKVLTTDTTTKKDKWTAKDEPWKYLPTESTWYGGSKSYVEVKVDFKEFYPYKAKKMLAAIEFGVCGKRSGGYTVSPWAYKTYELAVPRHPTVSHELDGTAANVATYSWSTTTDDQENKIFSNVQWQTLCLKDCGKAPKQVTYTKANATKNGYGWDEGSARADYSKTITENSDALFVNPNNRTSYTRYFRCRARGPAGNSEWVYTKHVFARPHKPTGVTTKWTKNGNTGYIATVKWTEVASDTHPVDYVSIQYCMETPDAGLQYPGNGSWTDAYTIKDTKSADRVTFNIDGVISDNTCVYARVVAFHDVNETSSNAVLFEGLGKLAEPHISTCNPTTQNVYVEVDNQALDVPDSFVDVFYRIQNRVNASSKKYKATGKWQLLGTLPHGTSSATLIYPEEIDDTSKVGFSAIAYCYDSTDTSKRKRAMGSTRNVFTTNIPLAPSITKLVSGNDGQSAIVYWNWNWRSANAAEIAWSDYALAWESTDEPSSYTVVDTTQNRLVVRGLEPGKPWYFRARLLNENSEGTVSTPWSDVDESTTIEISTNPYTPGFRVEPNVIVPDEEFTLYWSYFSDDNKKQGGIDIQCATGEDLSDRNEPYDENTNPGGYYFLETKSTSEKTLKRTLSDYQKLGRVTSSEDFPDTWGSGGMPELERVDDFKDWEVGKKYYIRCRLWSETGLESEWSEWVTVTVTAKPEAVITITSTETVASRTYTSVVDYKEDSEDDDSAERTETEIFDLPIVVRVSGAGEGGQASFYIERAEDFEIKRPDDVSYVGHRGEVVCSMHQDSSDEEYNEFVIDTDDIIGYLDDGARYNLVATVRDANNLTAEARIDNVVVNWSDQAVVPTAVAELDEATKAMKITVTTQTTWHYTDRFDLYRLTADKPELIIQNGRLGVPYVDPYPGLGKHCGHRVVFKTKNGDYTTTSNAIAWVDLTPENNANEFNNWIPAPYLDTFAVIIDFDGKRVELPYNINISNNWAKDFTETKYLGGSVIGDWNAAVSRTSAVSTAVVVLDDWDTIILLRQLAAYPGVCHVRMPDGSSFSADVQVQENREEQWVNKLASFSLDITRIDSTSLDGMTYEAWMSDKEV